MKAGKLANNLQGETELKEMLKEAVKQDTRFIKIMSDREIRTTSCDGASNNIHVQSPQKVSNFWDD